MCPREKRRSGLTWSGLQVSLYNHQNKRPNRAIVLLRVCFITNMTSSGLKDLGVNILQQKRKSKQKDAAYR